MTSSTQPPAPKPAPPLAKKPVKPVISEQGPIPKNKVGIPAKLTKAAKPAPAPAPKPAPLPAKKPAPVMSVAAKATSAPANFGFLGTLTLKEAFQHLGAQIGYAFAITIGILIGIEWLMPGSVLPFINIVSLLPFSFVAVVFLIAFKGRQQGFLNTLNILVGIIITVALLASMLTNMPIYGLRTILLAGAVALIIAVWAITMYTER